MPPLPSEAKRASPAPLLLGAATPSAHPHATRSRNHSLYSQTCFPHRCLLSLVSLPPFPTSFPPVPPFRPPRYGQGDLRATTRQAFQLHGVLKGNLKTVIATIANVGSNTYGGCGDINRNVMTPAVCFPNNPAYVAAQEYSKVCIGIGGVGLCFPNNPAYVAAQGCSKVSRDGKGGGGVGSQPPRFAHAHTTMPASSPNPTPHSIPLGIEAPSSRPLLPARDLTSPPPPLLLL